MKTVVLPLRMKVPLNKKPVPEVVPDVVIEEACRIVEESGRFVGIYVPDMFRADDEAKVYYSLKYQESDRLSGIHSSSLIFGSAPRDPIKRLPARRCAFNGNNKKAYADLLRIGSTAQSLFEKHAPEQFAVHKKAIENMSTYWLMPYLQFTSGIINNSNQLFYHTDNGNTFGCYSMMYTFRTSGVVGGYLHLPEYNVLVKNGHNSLLIFDGATVLHGVTPFKKVGKDAKRITIVYYCLEKMLSCCPDEKSEVEFQNEKRTKALWS